MIFYTSAYGATSSTAPLSSLRIPRRHLLSSDLRIKIYYCGVCHTDIHMVREWEKKNFPLVPGHEIVGRVEATGDQVTQFKVGDWVGVGCLVDSCHHCGSCQEGLEQYCETGKTSTYNSPDPYLNRVTYGGYSHSIVVNEAFVLSIPKSLDPAKTAPLLCAGATTYSAFQHVQLKRGQKVAIIGMGGLGHIALQIAKAMGVHTSFFTSSTEKLKDQQRFKADEAILSIDELAFKAQHNQFDVVLSTIPYRHEVDPYLSLLKRDGILIVVGAVAPLDAVNGELLIRKRLKIMGSFISGITETQAMLEFCAKHQIQSEIELISMDAVNTAWEKMIQGQARYRFVIEMEK